LETASVRGFSNFAAADSVSRRIESELSRTHGFQVSCTTIDKVLAEGNSKPLSRPRLDKKRITRYAKEIPGERMQMDTCKIGPGIGDQHYR
jgi:hypothetical protein